MDKQSIKDKLIGMMDRYGLLPHPRANQIKSTTEFYHLCKQFGILTNDDVGRYNNSVMSLMIEEGLLCRYPESPVREELEQQDNYESVASSFSLARGFKCFSKWFMEYGFGHFFHYNSNEGKVLSFKEWLSCFRQPYVLGWFTLCSGFRFTTMRILMGLVVGYVMGSLIGLTWGLICGIIVGGGLDILHLWLAIIVAGWSKGTSSKLLVWQFTQPNYFYKFLVWIPILIFKWKLRKEYGEYPAQELFGQYYCIGTGMELLADFAQEAK
jgi:hypothetical protein